MRDDDGSGVDGDAWPTKGKRFSNVFDGKNMFSCSYSKPFAHYLVNSPATHQHATQITIARVLVHT